MLLPIVLFAALARFRVSVNALPTAQTEGNPQVAIEIRGEPVGFGVIIHSQLVLTSWSILKDKPKNEIKVIALSDEPTRSKTTYNVKDMTSTADYHYSRYEIKKSPNGASRPVHNLAIIKVDTNFNLGKNSNLISVDIADKNYQPPKRTPPTIYGFDNQTEPVLAYLPLVKEQHCNEIFKDFGGLSDGEFCAGGKHRLPAGATFCSGSEGLPLIIEGRVIGIASWIYECEDLTFPLVFTSVSAHYDFIIGSMADMLETDDKWFKPTWEVTWWKKGLVKIVKNLLNDPSVCDIGPRRKKIRDDVCKVGCGEHGMDDGGCDDGICLCRALNGDRSLWDILTNTNSTIKTCLGMECKYWD